MIKRNLIRTIIVLAAITNMSLIAFGETREKIHNVNITIDIDSESSDLGSDERPSLIAESRSDDYTVDEIVLAKEYYDDDTEDSDDTNNSKYSNNEYVIVLTCEDSKYFDIEDNKHIHIKGGEAEFVKASRRDNGTTFVIDAKIDDSNLIGSAPTFDGLADRRGSWSEVYNASYYEIRVSGPKGVKTKTVNTYATSYDFTPFMQKVGEYRVLVRGVSNSEKKSDWSEGYTFTASEEDVAENNKYYKVKTKYTFLDNQFTPANERKEYINAGWKKSETSDNEWYLTPEGLYPQSTWYNINNNWYYFDENGYVLKNTTKFWKGKIYNIDENGVATLRKNNSTKIIRDTETE